MPRVEFVHKLEGKRTHLAAYTTSDGMIHVAYLGAFPAETTQCGGSERKPELLAGMMLSEFITKKSKSRA